MLTGTLAACGGSGGESTSSAGGKSLQMWTFKQSHVAALQNAAKGFAKETGVSVDVQAITPDDAFLTKVQAAAKTGDLPDVMEVHTNGDDFTFGAAGLLQDLSGDVKDAWAKNYLPSVRGEGTVTQTYYDASLTPGSKTVGIKLGQRFSVPMSIGTFGIVYANKKQLEAAGITKAPTSWEEFIAALDAVHRVNPETGGISLGLKSPSTGLEWLMQPMAFGLLGKAKFEALFGNDAGSDWSSAAGEKVLERYGQITPYWMPGTQSLDIDGADLAFAQGKSSFDIGGTFTLAFLAQNGFDTNNIISFPVPAPSDGAIPNLKLAPFALTGLSVSATTSNKAAALDWLQYLAGPKVATQFAKDSYDVPPTDLGDDPTSTVGPVLGAMLSSFGEGDNAYNAGDTAYRPSTYDPGNVGSVLMNFTPLQLTDVSATSSALAKLIGSYWAEK